MQIKVYILEISQTQKQAWEALQIKIRVYES